MIERISRIELMNVYQVEIQFIDDLEEAGLLQFETENSEKFLAYTQLSRFEKLANWHYDLEVNLPGLEVISHLLSKIEELQNQNLVLKKSTFPDQNWEEIDF